MRMVMMTNLINNFILNKTMTKKRVMQNGEYEVGTHILLPQPRDASFSSCFPKLLPGPGEATSPSCFPDPGKHLPKQLPRVGEVSRETA